MERSRFTLSRRTFRSQPRSRRSAFGSPSIHWESTKPVEIVLDSRLGRVTGRITPNAEPGPEGRMGVILSLASGGDLPRSVRDALPQADARPG